MLCIGVSVPSGFCPRINSMPSVLLIGARSTGLRELMVSMTRGEMMTEEFLAFGEFREFELKESRESEEGMNDCVAGLCG